MELIKDKIKENVKRRDVLLDLCKQIKLEDTTQQGLIREEEKIAEEISKGLISKKVITTVRMVDLTKKDRYSEEKAAINNLGIGYQPTYGQQMNTLSRKELLNVLKQGKLLMPFVKRKSAMMRLELFENCLKNYNEIVEFKVDLEKGLKTSDFDTAYTQGEDKREKGSIKTVKVDSPDQLGTGYHDCVDIKYLSQYTVVEEFYEQIKKAYETILQDLKNNNKVLKSILDDTKEKLGPWLIIKEL